MRPGFSEELDHLRLITRDVRRFVAELEAGERERTGIKSLKVGYNRVFGYYIEISKANVALAPEHYERRQSLVNAERYATPQLREYESQILTAKDRAAEIETAIFRQVCGQVAAAAAHVLATAGAVAELDVACGLAEAAARYGYVRPSLNDGDAIEIRDGRHPMVERSLAAGAFVPNDTHLSSGDAQIGIITGPNMAGKSTYLRQVAVIVLMAQCGSFVPASAAAIGVVDRVFTRVGAGDDLTSGQSTFMVEMIETSAILHNATARSLLILDEIGRGTSTYDGMAIARAVVEYLHNRPGLQAKTLFATHYHELVDLAAHLPRVRNFNVAVAEEHGRIVFLRRIVPGGADRSYGVHVAELAGLPKAVVQRAREVLLELETDVRQHSGSARVIASPQLSLFAATPPDDGLRRELADIDVDAMTPLDAMRVLYELARPRPLWRGTGGIVTEDIFTERQRKFVAQPRIGRLGTTNSDGTPLITPVWYRFEDGAFLVLTERGSRKHRNIERDPRVAFCIDDERPPYHTVLVTGRVTVEEVPGRDGAKRWRSTISATRRAGATSPRTSTPTTSCSASCRRRSPGGDG